VDAAAPGPSGHPGAARSGRSLVSLIATGARPLGSAYPRDRKEAKGVGVDPRRNAVTREIHPRSASPRGRQRVARPVSRPTDFVHRLPI